MYARVKTESVCLVGRTERDGIHAKRLGDVERALEKDSRSVVLALGFDWDGKKESEKIVSAWRRYVDVSISMVESTCESAVGRGRDSKCNGSEDDGIVELGVALHSEKRRGYISDKWSNAVSN